MYLKYLLVHPDNYDNDRVREIARMYNLDFIGKSYLERLRESCKPPTPFYPEDRRHPPSRDFLRKEKLTSIFEMEEPMRLALRILVTPRAKELVESFLISRSALEWICAALKRADVIVPRQTIEHYRHYFFNIDLVDSTELRALMEVRSHTDFTEDEDEKSMAFVHNTANKGDSRVLSAKASSPMVANMMNVLRMGLLPSNIEIDKIASATRAAAAIQTLESITRGQPERGRDYAMAAKLMTEIMESTGGAGDELEESLTKLALVTETNEVPNIKQLGGTHTVDMQPEAKGELDAGSE